MRTTLSLLALMLVACARPDAAPQDSPAPAAEPAPAQSAPSEAAPSETPPPADAPTGPAQPSPEAPPPTESSPAPKPTAAEEEPAVETMRLAQAGAKIGVPVDLRYSFASAPLPNQPAVLHLAAVPRVDGSQLRVSIQEAEGLSVSSGTLAVQKASAAGVYRQQYSVTRQATSPAQIRVLVTMGIGEGSAHGFYSIPLEGGNTAQKQDSVKRR